MVTSRILEIRNTIKSTEKKNKERARYQRKSRNFSFTAIYKFRLEGSGEVVYPLKTYTRSACAFHTSNSNCLWFFVRDIFNQVFVERQTVNQEPGSNGQGR